MAITIITDSAVDMPRETADELDIKVIPLAIHFGDETYLDSVDLSHEEFFEKLTSGIDLPKTSQITPLQYEEYFSEAVASGNEVICIVISSKLSGCYANALTAAAQFDGRVTVVDSESASLGQYIFVKLAAALRDEGKSLKEIVTVLEKKKKKIRILALIDTLEYLQKGGRLSRGAAVIGELIKIKPVITVVDGEVAVLGKARGSKKGHNMLTEFTQNSGGFDYSLPIVVARSGESAEVLEEYIKEYRHLVEGKMDVDATPRITIGAAIGTHVGPGAIGLAFFSRS